MITVTPPAVIKLENVSWSYARSHEWALKNISLEIEEGSFAAVMGENSSGKTTFCRLLNGLIPHSLAGTLLGTVTVDGLDTTTSSAAELAAKTGMTLDDPDAQLFTTTVYDEAAFALENLLLEPEVIKEKVNRALKAAGLLKYSDFPPSKLSGGQKQRLAIAAAMAMAERILVLDDPVSQLDSSGASDVLSFINDLRREKKLTVVMAAGFAEEIIPFADTVYILRNGSLAAQGAPCRIFSDRYLLKQCGIQLPQIQEFACRMEDIGCPLPRFPTTLDEACEASLLWYNAEKS